MGGEKFGFVAMAYKVNAFIQTGRVVNPAKETSDAGNYSCTITNHGTNDAASFRKMFGIVFFSR